MSDPFPRRRLNPRRFEFDFGMAFPQVADARCEPHAPEEPQCFEARDPAAVQQVGEYALALAFGFLNIRVVVHISAIYALRRRSCPCCGFHRRSGRGIEAAMLRSPFPEIDFVALLVVRNLLCTRQMPHAAFGYAEQQGDLRGIEHLFRTEK